MEYMLLFFIRPDFTDHTEVVHLRALSLRHALGLRRYGLFALTRADGGTRAVTGTGNSTLRFYI